MNIRYLRADNLMCLLLPKNNVMLPWRRQPNVLFGFTFREWQKFISDRRDGIIRSYREIRELPVEEQKLYFYAEGALAQFYEIAFSGEEATNIIATEAPMSESEITDEISAYINNDVSGMYQKLSAFNLSKSTVTIKPNIATTCLRYCYLKSMEGSYDVWIRK